MQDILISVIMPTYGRSRYLERAVSSILSGTHENTEIVIVNDNIPGSGEDTATEEAIKAFKDARIKAVHTSGKTGGGAARNAGLKACTGEYIAFLDDDDRYLPGKLEKQLEFMLDNDLEMSWQDVIWHDENEKLLEYRRQDRVRDFSKEGLLRSHLLASIAPTSIYMVKKSAMTDTCLFGEVPRGQDFYFMVNCINAGLKMGYMPGAYVVQYVHKGERISQGPGFIKKVTEEFEDKKRLGEGLLTKREMRLLDFRLSCVIAFEELRSRSLAKAIPYFAKAFILSPAGSFKEAYRFFRRH